MKSKKSFFRSVMIWFYSVPERNRNRIFFGIFFIANLFAALWWFKQFFITTISNSHGLIEINTSYTIYLWGCVLSWVLMLVFVFIILETKNKKLKTIFSALTVASAISIFLFTFFSLSFIEKECVKNIRNLEQLIYKEVVDKAASDLSEEIREIPEGGSLCGTLGVTEKEALFLARLYDFKYFYKDNSLIVIVSPEEEFVKIGNIWMLPEKE